MSRTGIMIGRKDEEGHSSGEKGRSKGMKFGGQW